MSETILKRKGGRPPLPPAPQNAAECRELIARETVKTSPSERRLRLLYRLLKSFVAAEDAARMDLKNRLQQEANTLQAAELELKRQDYRIRFVARPLGQQTLLKRVERLEAELAATKSGQNQPSIPTIDMGTFDGKAGQ